MESDSKSNDEPNTQNGLLEKFYKLKNAIPLHKHDLIETANQLEKELIKYYNEGRWKDEEKLRSKVSELEAEVIKLNEKVTKLEEEVVELKEEATELKKRAQLADAINAGEAMKIVLHHLAKFIYPSTTKIGTMRLKEMLCEIKNHPELNGIWQQLLEFCEMGSWTYRHTNVHKGLVQSRNTNAHVNFFDFETLLAAMLEVKPNYEIECEDILRMFKKVDHLMKFGIIAEECVENVERPDECENYPELVELMHRAKIWARSDVEDFQNIKLIEAEEHVVQYFPDVGATGICSDTITLILDTNRLRFCKLVRNKVAEVLEDIPQIFDVKRKFTTLWGLIKFSRSSQWKKDREDDGLKWHLTTMGIYWTESHDDALKEMEGPPDNQLEDVIPLPLHVAKLHVADFVENGKLWGKGSEIFKIFAWKEIKIVKMAEKAKSNQPTSDVPYTN